MSLQHRAIVHSHYPSSAQGPSLSPIFDLDRAGGKNTKALSHLTAGLAWSLTDISVSTLPVFRVAIAPSRLWVRKSAATPYFI